MDKVTQMNAANAEQSASGSQEMSAQADQMTSMVNELVTLVGGRGAGSGNDQSLVLEKKHKSPVREGSTIAAETTKNKKVAVLRAEEVRPDQVIPFSDDDDFQNF